MSLVVCGRRGFLAGFAALVASPSLVRATSLMPISARNLLPRIGEIKGIVGPVPDGWVPCDGRWLIHQSYTDLFAAIDRAENKWGKFFLPDLTARAEQARRDGYEIGRYVIYGGTQHVAHKAWLDETVSYEKMVHIEGERCKDITL